MQCYTELTEPTAVSHSLCLPFLSPSANNLIVSKSSLLQVYSLKSILALPENGPSAFKNTNADGTATKSQDRLPTTKLILIAQYELSGTVTALARVKILNSKSGAEALLVAVKDAKLSLVEWDPERHIVSTISIHYYEQDSLQSNPWDPDVSQCSSILTVDPGSRCAALKFGLRRLAILPFHQPGDDLVMDEYDPEIDEVSAKTDIAQAQQGPKDGKETPYASSFVLSCLALDPVLSHPIHLSFLNEYREPTLGVLYSTNATSPALAYERMDNVCYAVYTIDIEQRASTTLLSVNKLPSDLQTIVPLSRAIGGVLIIGLNELIHVDQSGKTNGVAVNEFAKQASSFAMADQSELGMKLEGSVIKQLGPDNADILLVLPSGELAMISFKIDGRSVSGFSIARIAHEQGGRLLSSGSSCASIIGRGRVFLGSESGDSVILGWSQSNKLKGQQLTMDVDMEHLDDGEGDVMNDLEDEDDLYAGEESTHEYQQRNQTVPTDRSPADYIFRVHDSLLNVAPLNHVTMTTSKDHLQSMQTTSDIVCSSRRGEAGGLTFFQSGISLKRVDSLDICNARAIWPVRTTTAEVGNDSDGFDVYLLASVTNEDREVSKAFLIKDGSLQEVRDTDFDPDAGKTVDVGTLSSSGRIVQVLTNEIRTYDSSESLFPFSSSSTIFPSTSAQWSSLWSHCQCTIQLDYYFRLLYDSCDCSPSVPAAVQRGKGQFPGPHVYQESHIVLMKDEIKKPRTNCPRSSLPSFVTADHLHTD